RARAAISVCDHPNHPRAARLCSGDMPERYEKYLALSTKIVDLLNINRYCVSHQFLVARVSALPPTAAARTLSLASVARMSDEEARDTFRQIRWSATNGNPVCPECGSLSVYSYACRPLWRCKDCRRQFSLTSNTILISGNSSNGQRGMHKRGEFSRVI